MKRFKNNMYRSFYLTMSFALAGVLLSCEEEDPFVDRTAAPVLIVFDDVPGYLAGGGITSVPSIVKQVTTDNFAEPVLLSLSVYELDKSGILDHTVGIDSIPVANLAIVFSRRDGSLPIEGSSDANGKVVITTTWADLGVEDVESIVNTPGRREITIPVLWRGEHNGQSFSRYAQVLFRKPA